MLQQITLQCKAKSGDVPKKATNTNHFMVFLINDGPHPALQARFEGSSFFFSGDAVRPEAPVYLSPQSVAPGAGGGPRLSR